MGQEELKKLLKQNPNTWFTMKEIQKQINLSERSLRRSISRLLKSKEIKEKRLYAINIGNQKWFSKYQIGGI